jgi:hypothetical protein
MDHCTITWCQTPHGAVSFLAGTNSAMVFSSLSADEIRGHAVGFP